MEVSLFASCPYVVFAETCPDGHLHVLGGFISSVPAEENEPDTYTNETTGHVMRVVSEIIYSLN